LSNLTKGFFSEPTVLGSQAEDFRKVLSEKLILEV
jgi:hypothetical protein